MKALAQGCTASLAVLKFGKLFSTDVKSCPAPHLSMRMALFVYIRASCFLKSEFRLLDKETEALRGDMILHPWVYLGERPCLVEVLPAYPLLVPRNLKTQGSLGIH